MVQLAMSDPAQPPVWTPFYDEMAILTAVLLYTMQETIGARVGERIGLDHSSSTHNPLESNYVAWGSNCWISGPPREQRVTRIEWFLKHNERGH